MGTSTWISTLRQALQDADATLDGKQNRVVELNTEVTGIKFEIEALQAEKAGLTLALRRHGGGDDSAAVEEMEAPRTLAPASEKSPWRTRNRVAVVEMALRQLAGPASPTDVAALLKENDREEDADAVSAALAHLKRSDRADRVGRAQWVIRSKNAESPAGAGLSVLPTPTSDERRPDVEPSGDRDDHLSEWHDSTGGSTSSIVEE